MHATNDDLIFEEFKDGFVGIRTHPDLRPTPSPKHGVNKVFERPVTVKEKKEKGSGENGQTGFIITERLKETGRDRIHEPPPI